MENEGEKEKTRRGARWNGVLRSRWLAIVRQFRRGETPARRATSWLAAGLVASPGERRRKRWGIMHRR